MPVAISSCINTALRPFISGLAPGTLQSVPLRQRQVLHEVEGDVSNVYFPESGLVSLVTVVKDGDSEVGVIGREGMTGTSAIAHAPSFTRATVQIPGQAWRMSVSAFLELYRQSGDFRSVVVRFNTALISQIQQNVACSSRHAVRERTARWLLQALDRSSSPVLALTQEVLAHSIGAHRATVVMTVAAFESEGMLRHARGKIEILDSNRLSKCACECYRQVHRRYGKLLPALEPPVFAAAEST